jgi:hypothetical protein
MVKMSTGEDANQIRIKQAEELLKLFEEDTGHPAGSMEDHRGMGASARGEFVIRTKGICLKA